jgi:hypothetical protein
MPVLSESSLAQRQVGERDVDAVGDPPGLELDDRRQPDPCGDRVVGAQVADQLDELRDQLVGVRDVGLDQLARLELAVLERGRGDLGPPDVEPDEPAAHSLLAAGSSRKTNSEPWGGRTRPAGASGSGGSVKARAMASALSAPRRGSRPRGRR